jgi:hypothetical protein
MKAEYRCRWICKGDRCRKTADHIDTEHEGQFIKWVTGEDVRPIVPIAMPFKTYRWIIKRANAVIRYKKVGK